MGVYDFMLYEQERKKWLNRAEDPLLAPAERAVFIAMVELIIAQKNLASARWDEQIYLREGRKT